MAGVIQSLYRYPIKGFTPEPLAEVALRAGDFFPDDRLYAVENGPSAFDPAAPAFVSKRAFTVLASIPKVAQAHTAFDPATGALTVSADHHPPFAGELVTEPGRAAFAAWLTAFLDPDDLRGPLKVLTAPPHRFTDSREGFVSVINLASVRDLESKFGAPIDPLRFRANLYVEGWPPWVEMDWPVEAQVTLGAAQTALLKPIVRCAATHVDPSTGERDQDLCGALWSFYGHRYCGLYLKITGGGRVRIGDWAERTA
jgi:uncharacterized protein YcbX